MLHHFLDNMIAQKKASLKTRLTLKKLFSIQGF